MRNTAVYILLFPCLILACRNKDNFSATDGTATETVFVSNGLSSGKSIQKLKPVEYVNWIQNNESGLRAERVIADLSFSVQYKPIDYVALKILGPAAANATSVQKSREEYEGMQYFNFTISHLNGSDDLLKYNVSGNQEYQERVNYFSFQMQNDFMLIDGKDSLRCKLFHYERVYGIAPYANFLLAFDLPEKRSGKIMNDKVLVYRDRLFGNSLLKFKIREENLSNIPELIF